MERAIAMTKIGILTCSNVTHELGCCSMFCLQDINANEGPFAAYADNGGAELMGVLSCAGCPTAVGPEKILSRVRAMAELGAEAIHLSNCMMALCPFAKKYKSLIGERFPDVKLVEGSHHVPGDPQEMKRVFRAGVKELLTRPRPAMVDMVKEVVEMYEQAAE